MDTRQLLSGLVAVLVVGGVVAAGLYFYTPTKEQGTPTPEVQEEPTHVTFNSTELGLMFQYPANYTLQTHEQGTSERMWTVLTLIDSEILQSAIENGASEGPPAIAVQVFNNPEGYTANEWVNSMSYSNYKLSSDGVLNPTTVGGEPGLRYRYSGLFETDATVVVKGEKVYMFSVDWLAATDANVSDFRTILETVTFY